MQLADTKFTVDFVRRVLSYDPKTGILTWRTRSDVRRQWNTKYAGTQAGSVARSGYRYISFKGLAPVGAHRIAWCHFHGDWPTFTLDHINGMRDDNRILNLRPVDGAENSVNKARQKNNTSGFVGVSFERQRGLWRARVNFRRMMYDVGFFSTAEEAAAAREEFARKIHGEFAPKNPGRQKYRHHRDTPRKDR